MILVATVLDAIFVPSDIDHVLKNPLPLKQESLEGDGEDNEYYEYYDGIRDGEGKMSSSENNIVIS